MSSRCTAGPAWAASRAATLLQSCICKQCAVVQIHQPTRDFIALARVALETTQVLEESNPARYELLTALNEAFISLDTRDPLDSDHFYQSVQAASHILKACIENAAPPLDVIVHATGHAHIDVAWLWTLGQTPQSRAHVPKCDPPDGAISGLSLHAEPAAGLSIIKEDQPELFEAIRQRIAKDAGNRSAGCGSKQIASQRRRIAGAAIPIGRTFFREHFGRDAESPVLWLPDVFGYAWALRN